MPSDSGHSIEEDSTYEAEERLPTHNGDTPDPLQGLIPVGTQVESAKVMITPIPDPITPPPGIEDEEEPGDSPNPAQELPYLRTQPELPFTHEDEGESGNIPEPAQGRLSKEEMPQRSLLPYTDIPNSSDVCTTFDVVGGYTAETATAEDYAAPIFPKPIAYSTYQGQKSKSQILDFDCLYYTSITGSISFCGKHGWLCKLPFRAYYTGYFSA